METAKDHRILIVDGDEAIHDDLENMLLHKANTAAPEVEFERQVSGQEAGDDSGEKGFSASFMIDHARQGEEALRTVEQAAAEGYPYSLIFMEILMPPGCDGITAVSKIWEKHSDDRRFNCFYKR